MPPAIETALTKIFSYILIRVTHFFDYFFGKVSLRIQFTQRAPHQYTNYNITEVTVLASNNTKRLQSVTSAWLKFPNEEIEVTMMHSILESHDFLGVKMSLPIPIDLAPGQAKLISMHFSDSLPIATTPTLLEIELTGVQRKSVKLGSQLSNLKTVVREVENKDRQNV
ncbi:hypothetical protein [Bdellovibrio sp. BCCA]|uniref:hypothetical protein n=1 Tax=Bdellovibrio sp. BCCA TaxID=3136281 RepID=UPI0030F059DF